MYIAMPVCEEEQIAQHTLIKILAVQTSQSSHALDTEIVRPFTYHIDSTI